MPNEVRGRLDHAIDRAVRGMMQVDPQPGLRHRVAERMNGPARRSWLVPAFAAAAVVLVVVVSIVTLRISPSTPSTTPQIATAPRAAASQQRGAAPELREQPPAAPQVATAPKPPAVRRPSTPAAGVRGGSIFGPPSQRVTAASIDPETPPAVEAPVLSITAPGVVEQIPPIVIEPIVVTPITITPLIVRAPDRR